MAEYAADEIEVEEAPELAVDDEIEVDAPNDRDAPFEYNEMSANLVAEFMKHPIGQDALEDIAKQVIEDFDTGYDATEEYRDRMARDWRVFAGELKEKSFPWEDCANAHVPFMLENLSRLQFRMYGEIFADWQNVFAAVPLGPDDDKVSDIVSIHTNWQFREQITDFKRQHHRGTLAFLLHGDVTSHSYWDEMRRCNTHEILTPDEFVIPYVYTTTRPDYSDVPWRAKIMHRYRHELEAMRGSWHGVDTVLDRKPPGWMAEPEQRMAQAVSEVQGIEPPEDDGKSPYKLIWYEGWAELPNQSKQRFIQAIVDHETKGVLKLSIHEQPNWQDKARYDRQLAELQEFRFRSTEHTMVVGQIQAQLGQANELAATALSAGMMGPMQQEGAFATLEQASMAPLPPPPEPPLWMKDPNDPVEMPEPPRMEPIHLFAHAVCIEPLVGNLGLSYGRIEGDYNRAANTALNQFIDAATIGNCGAHIIDEQLEFVGSEGIRPGAWLRAKGVAAADIANSIYKVETQPGNPQLLEIVSLMGQYASTAVQAPNVLSGEPGKSGETYRGLAARLEQATKQLSVVSRKYVDFTEQQCKNNALLNSIYLDDEEMIMVTDHTMVGQKEPIKVGRYMYERSYRFEVRADLRFTSQAQRIQEADDVVKMVMTNPMLMSNQKLVHYAIKKSFEARGRFDLVALLGAPPEPPPAGGAPGAPGQVPPGAPGAPSPVAMAGAPPQ